MFLSYSCNTINVFPTYMCTLQQDIKHKYTTPLIFPPLTLGMPTIFRPISTHNTTRSWTTLNVKGLVNFSLFLILFDLYKIELTSLHSRVQGLTQGGTPLIIRDFSAAICGIITEICVLVAILSNI